MAGTPYAHQGSIESVQLGYRKQVLDTIELCKGRESLGKTCHDNRTIEAACFSDPREERGKKGGIEPGYASQIHYRDAIANADEPFLQQTRDVLQGYGAGDIHPIPITTDHFLSALWFEPRFFAASPLIRPSIPFARISFANSVR